MKVMTWIAVALSALFVSTFAFAATAISDDSDDSCKEGTVNSDYEAEQCVARSRDLSAVQAGNNYLDDADEDDAKMLREEQKAETHQEEQEPE